MTIEGYTLMHITALHETVAFLLRKGIPPMFAPPLQDCAEDRYILCPMFLVTACATMRFTVSVASEIESDALMLLG